ncbi:MAG: glycosyltransferase family 39 protein [Bacteroidota bacterium]|nr:glycosyltransferase family 39 protein [Bacteroidota bacterium]
MEKLRRCANKFLWIGPLGILFSLIFKYFHLQGTLLLLSTSCLVFFLGVALKLEQSKHGLGLLLLFSWVLFYRSGQMPLRAEEPRRAVVSIEMMLNQDFVVPKIHGYPYLNKPPMFNWMQVLSFKIFRSFGPFAARFPGLIFLILTALMTVWFHKKYFGQINYLVALIFLGTSDLLFYGAVNAGEIDLFYTFISAVQLFSLLIYSKQKGPFWFLLSFVFMTIGFLTKGFPSILMQGISVGLIFLIRLKRQRPKWIHLFFGLLISLVILGGYFWLYGRKADAWVYLVNLVGESQDKARHSAGGFVGVLALIFKNVLTFLKLCLPWIVVPIVWKVQKKPMKINKDFIFFFWILAANLFFYLVSGTLKERYLYPFLPLISLLFYLFYSQNGSTKWLQYFFLFIILARFVYNEAVLPLQAQGIEKDKIYGFAHQVAEETKGKPVFYGEIMTKDLTFLSYNKTIHTPTPIRYELIYQLSSTKKMPILYKKVPEKGDYFLTFANKEEEGIVKYFDHWAQKELILKKF